MAKQKIYLDDIQIAKSLIKRDEAVTRRYYYEQCYPLFKSIYDNYYTDCKCCKEFMDEIYLLVIAPGKSGKCQMENFRGESTLMSWLKTVCIYYCYHKYELKKRIPFYETLPQNSEKDDEKEDGGDIIDRIGGSIEIDLSRMNREDVETLLDMMPNKRYSRLIRLLYLEQKSHKETAEALGMTMKNYYNKRILAEAQYEQVCRKEECHG